MELLLSPDLRYIIPLGSDSSGMQLTAMKIRRIRGGKTSSGFFLATEETHYRAWEALKIESNSKLIYSFRESLGAALYYVQLVFAC